MFVSCIVTEKPHQGSVNKVLYCIVSFRVAVLDEEYVLKYFLATSLGCLFRSFYSLA